MFFKRLLTIWFLLFTLNSSVAWAFPDNLPVAGDRHALADDGQHKHPLPWQHDENCDDHCGHFSAHVVALISTTAAFQPAPRSTVFCFSQRIPGSRDPAPPFQPPIG